MELLSSETALHIEFYIYMYTHTHTYIHMTQVYHKVELLSPETAFYIEFYGKEESMVEQPSGVPTRD